MKKILISFIFLFFTVYNMHIINADSSFNITNEKSYNEKEAQIIVQYRNSLNTGISRMNSIPSNIKNIENLVEDIQIITFRSDENIDNYLDTLLEDKNIVYAEKNIKRSINNIPYDPYYNKQWWITQISADKAWEELSKKSNLSSVTVAVIDSGIEKGHEDLKNRIADGGYNFLDNSENVFDINGHGTTVSGIIAAESSNGFGISGVGGGLDIKILPLQVIDQKGDAYLDDIIKAINYAISKKVDIINLSLGSEHYSYIENYAIQKAFSNGILIVAAAGNSGNNNYNYPASYDNVISVSATDQNTDIAYFSNFNDRIDLAAPGKEVYSCNLNNMYGYHNGTSFASPIVAGVAAILKSIDKSLSPQQIEDIMKTTGNDMGAYGFDVHYGSGIVDADAAVKKAMKLSNNSITGDINADNKVSAADATLLLRHIVGIIKLSDDKIALADVNYDKKVNSADATLILRYSIGLISNF